MQLYYFQVQTATPVGLLQYCQGESLGAVLAPLGCCYRTPQTGWLTSNRSLFLTVLEAGRSRLKMLADSASGEGPLPGSQMVPSSFKLTAGRGQGISSASRL